MPRASLRQAVKSLFRGDTYPADGPPPHRSAVVAFSMQVSGPQAPCGCDTQGFSPSSALLGLLRLLDGFEQLLCSVRLLPSTLLADDVAEVAVGGGVLVDGLTQVKPVDNAS